MQDVSEVAELVLSGGGIIVVELREKPWGEIRVVSDPNGYLWQIIANAR